MKKLGLIVLLTLGVLVAKSQTIITWEVLKDVKFTEEWSEEFQAFYMVPQFGNKVK